MFQYTVTNPSGHNPPVVVVRTKERKGVCGGWSWRKPYRVSIRCTDRARYGLQIMERRAASAMQYGLPGISADKYHPE